MPGTIEQFDFIHRFVLLLRWFDNVRVRIRRSVQVFDAEWDSWNLQYRVFHNYSVRDPRRVSQNQQPILGH